MRKASYEEALTAFEEAAAVVGQHGHAVEDLELNLGQTLERLDRYQEAEEHFRTELRTFPRNIHAYSSLTMLYHALEPNGAGRRDVRSTYRSDADSGRIRDSR